jgi:hypothetical protein
MLLGGKRHSKACSSSTAVPQKQLYERASRFSDICPTEPLAMPSAQKLTHDKALTHNLNPSTFGSFAEIGARQEVARGLAARLPAFTADFSIWFLEFLNMSSPHRLT